MEKKVLTEEDLQSLKLLNDRNQTLINSLGRIEYQITLLEEERKKLKTSLIDLEKENQTLGKQLTETYGSGQINLDTGEIILD